MHAQNCTLIALLRLSASACFCFLDQPVVPQVAITFHGGMQAIAYEWGSPIYPRAGHKDISPDDASQVAQFFLNFMCVC